MARTKFLEKLRSFQRYSGTVDLWPIATRLESTALLAVAENRVLVCHPSGSASRQYHQRAHRARQSNIGPCPTGFALGSPMRLIISPMGRVSWTAARQGLSTSRTVGANLFEMLIRTVWIRRSFQPRAYHQPRARFDKGRRGSCLHTANKWAALLHEPSREWRL